MKENEFARKLNIIRQTGCPQIQGAVRGRSVEDFDQEVIEFIADFVITTPPDTQAAINVAQVLLEERSE